MPLEPSKHNLELHKSVRAAELSIYRVLIYTFQMGDYRTVVKCWSITVYSIHPLSCFPLMESPLFSLVKMMSFVTNKPKKAKEKFKCWIFELFSLDIVSGPNMSLKRVVPVHEMCLLGELAK